MKPIKIAELFLLVVIISISLYSQERYKVYDYPIKGGTPEWKNLKTHEEMLKAVQIPYDILKEMSTIDLAQTCLDYPLFPDMWAFNSLQYGYEKVRDGFNGIGELYKRQEVGIVLLEKYCKMVPNEWEQNISSLEKGKYIAEFSKIEILLSQNEILDKLDNVRLVLLLKEVIKKNQVFSLYPEVYGINSMEPNTYLMGKIIIKLKDNEFISRIIDNKTLKYFLETGSRLDKKSYNDIIKSTYKYLEK